jgi:coenzyme PQQ precursor peptide PqqA
LARQVFYANFAVPSASGCGNSAERGSEAMRWSKPKIVEIAVGTEINSYACAAIA